MPSVPTRISSDQFQSCSDLFPIPTYSELKISAAAGRSATQLQLRCNYLRFRTPGCAYLHQLALIAPEKILPAGHRHDHSAGVRMERRNGDILELPEPGTLSFRATVLPGKRCPLSAGAHSQPSTLNPQPILLTPSCHLPDGLLTPPKLISLNKYAGPDGLTAPAPWKGAGRVLEGWGKGGGVLLPARARPSSSSSIKPPTTSKKGTTDRNCEQLCE